MLRQALSAETVEASISQRTNMGGLAQDTWTAVQVKKGQQLSHLETLDAMITAKTSGQSFTKALIDFNGESQHVDVLSDGTLGPRIHRAAATVQYWAAAGGTFTEAEQAHLDSNLPPPARALCVEASAMGFSDGMLSSGTCARVANLSSLQRELFMEHKREDLQRHLSSSSDDEDDWISVAEVHTEGKPGTSNGLLQQLGLPSAAPTQHVEAVPAAVLLDPQTLSSAADGTTTDSRRSRRGTKRAFVKRLFRGISRMGKDDHASEQAAVEQDGSESAAEAAGQSAITTEPTPGPENEDFSQYKSPGGVKAFCSPTAKDIDTAAGGVGCRRIGQVGRWGSGRGRCSWGGRWGSCSSNDNCGTRSCGSRVSHSHVTRRSNLDIC